MVPINFSEIQLQLKKERERVYVFDPVRKKWLVLTPEEHVRQCILHYLIHHLHYPKSLLSVEKKIMVGGLAKRFDVVVYNRTDHTPWMLIECKAPEVPITESTLQQLLSYHNTMQCNYWVLTNGHQTYCADATQLNNIRWIDSLPAYYL
ncbi:MAG: type I restriction enzyme HsdR N-terminal domain-containing protein [Sphingobacteriales bacterium]|nr:MAG: type I restriction enzyme HsdR N-terminal domain-containing protein [Sphingobacteriales bacterium]